MNSPSGLFTIHVEIGAAAVANYIAVGVGEGKAVSINVDGPVVAAFVSQNGGRDNFVIAIHCAGEFGCGRFASRQGVSDGTIGVNIIVETGSNDDAIASH